MFPVFNISWNFLNHLLENPPNNQEQCPHLHLQPPHQVQQDLVSLHQLLHLKLFLNLTVSLNINFILMERTVQLYIKKQAVAWKAYPLHQFDQPLTRIKKVITLKNSFKIVTHGWYRRSSVNLSPNLLCMGLQYIYLVWRYYVYVCSTPCPNVLSICLQYIYLVLIYYVYVCSTPGPNVLSICLHYIYLVLMYYVYVCITPGPNVLCMGLQYISLVLMHYVCITPGPNVLCMGLQYIWS